MKVKFESQHFLLKEGLLVPRDHALFSQFPETMLEAMALQTKYGFKLDKAAQQNISMSISQLEVVDPGQIYSILQDVIINSEVPSTLFRLLWRFGGLDFILPELKYCVNLKQGKYHTCDVFEHCLITMDAVPSNKMTVRLAALLHDIGKPEARRVENGVVVFSGHEKASVDLAQKWLHWLGAPQPIIDTTLMLIMYHDILFPIISDEELAKKLGKDHIEDMVDLWIGNAIGTGKALLMMGRIAIRKDAMVRVLYG